MAQQTQVGTAKESTCMSDRRLRIMRQECEGQQIFTAVDAETDEPIGVLNLSVLFQEKDVLKGIEEMRNYAVGNLRRITRAKLLDVIDVALSPSQATAAKRLVDNALSELIAGIEGKDKELRAELLR